MCSRLIGVAICMTLLFAALACFAWDGVATYYGWFGHSDAVPFVATACKNVLGATTMIEEKSLHNDEANTYLIDKRYWWHLGHGVITAANAVFAGICTDKDWSFNCDLYGPGQMAGGLSVTLVHLSSCNSALGVAPQMRANVAAIAWVGWTKAAGNSFMATSGRNWPADSNTQRTVAQVKAIQVARYAWLGVGDISILGNAAFVLDTDPVN